MFNGLQYPMTFDDQQFPQNMIQLMLANNNNNNIQPNNDLDWDTGNFRRFDLNSQNSQFFPIEEFEKIKKYNIYFPHGNYQ